MTKTFTPDWKIRTKESPKTILKGLSCSWTMAPPLHNWKVVTEALHKDDVMTASLALTGDEEIL